MEAEDSTCDLAKDAAGAFMVVDVADLQHASVLWLPSKKHVCPVAYFGAMGERVPVRTLSHIS